MAREEYLARIDDHKVIGTAHSYRRLMQRAIDPDKVSPFFHDMVTKCLTDDRFMGSPDNTEWFVYSRRLKLGMMVAFRRDFKDPSDSQRHFVIMTVYPKGSTRPLQPDTPSITV